MTLVYYQGQSQLDGGPVAVPYEVIERLASVAKSWSGYTEFWRLDIAQPYRFLLMASVHSRKDYEDATAMGWRCYRDRESAELMPNEIECPYYAHQVKCIDCKLCDGARPGDRRKNITAPFHGPGKGEAARAARLQVVA